jgi:dipeptidyl aminopeptidase/acylaminoacyl peptidase
MSNLPVWERRFRASKMSLPRWSRSVPDRTVFESTESGVWQVHCWDVATGTRRQVSDHPVGVIEGYPTLDGEGVLWFEDDTGSEAGRWLVQPFGGGDARPFVDGLPDGWSGGISQAPGVIAIGVSGRDGFAIYSAVDGEPAKELCRSTESIELAGLFFGNGDIAGLSTDGSLIALEHSEHGDVIHPAIRVIDARTGSIAGEQRDVDRWLGASAWSPVAGDQRLAVGHEREQWHRPALWDLSSGEWTDLPFELPGDAIVRDWWPDALAVLVQRTYEGRQDLFRLDLSNGAIRPVASPPGHILDARVRPDGAVWFLHSSGEHDRRVLDDGGREVIAPEGDTAPSGRPYVPWRFDNGEGDSVHGFYVTPEGEGPWPVMMYVHGGPTWLHEDRFEPEVQAYVDAGFAVGMANYRGSTGYGRDWRDRLLGDIGGPDVRDVTAGLHDLIASGIGDPDRAVVAGWSWGGYVTLMELGTNPELWRAGVAGVPVGDYAAGYAELSPTLQAYDRALLGGTPDEVPELMETRSPIVHADSVRAPVIFIIGEHDSRCPYQQAMDYVERIAERGVPHEVVTFATGHGSFDTDEDVRQQRLILDFLRHHVPGLRDV